MALSRTDPSSVALLKQWVLDMLAAHRAGTHLPHRPAEGDLGEGGPSLSDGIAVVGLGELEGHSLALGGVEVVAIGLPPPLPLGHDLGQRVAAEGGVLVQDVQPEVASLLFGDSRSRRPRAAVRLPGTSQVRLSR